MVPRARAPYAIRHPSQDPRRRSSAQLLRRGFCQIVTNLLIPQASEESALTSPSADRELAFFSATHLIDGFAKKSLSPVDVTQAILRRLERLEPKLNAFVLRDPEGALKSAQASDGRGQKGQPLGPRDGVPPTIQDPFLTRCWPT